MEKNNRMIKAPVLSILLMVLLCMSSCVAPRDICGEYHYWYPQKYPYIESYLSLSRDFSFKYEYKEHFLFGEASSGSWSHGKKSSVIFIRSSIQNLRCLPISVFTKYDDTSKMKRIVLDNPFIKDTLVDCFIIVNDTIKPLDNDQVTLNKWTDIDSICVMIFDRKDTTIGYYPPRLNSVLLSEKYYVSDRNVNYIHISFPQTVNYSMFYYKVILDSIKIRRKEIIFNGMKYKKQVGQNPHLSL